MQSITSLLYYSRGFNKYLHTCSFMSQNICFNIFVILQLHSQKYLHTCFTLYALIFLFILWLPSQKYLQTCSYMFQNLCFNISVRLQLRPQKYVHTCSYMFRIYSLIFCCVLKRICTYTILAHILYFYVMLYLHSIYKYVHNITMNYGFVSVKQELMGEGYFGLMQSLIK